MLVADVGRKRDVLADGEVREEDGSLRGVGEVSSVSSDTAAVRLQVFPESGCAASEMHSGIGYEAASGAEDGTFAAAGGAEEDGPRRG